MREIEVFYHTDSIYLYPKHITEKQVEEYVNAWKNDELFECAKTANADHFIYLTKTYDKNDTLIRIDFYFDVALDDEEFNKRVKANDYIEAQKENHVYYGVWHKGTNY